jgi:hypothetical protein
MRYRNIIKYLAICVLFIVVLLLRIPLLHEHHNYDELQFISFGKALFENGLYSTDLTATPIHSFFLGIIYKLAKFDEIHLRITVTVLLFLNAVLISIIGYRLRSISCGIASAFLYLLYMGSPVFQGHYLTKELFDNLCITVAVLLLFSIRTLPNMLFIGIVIGIDFTCRQTSILFGAAILIWQMLISPDTSGRLQHKVRYMVVFLAGVFIPILGEFIISAVYGQLGNHISAYKIFISYGSKIRGSSIALYFDNLWRLLKIQWIYMVSLGSIALFGIYKLHQFSKSFYYLLLLWISAAIFSSIITGGFYQHYTQVLIPPLALLAGYGASYIEQCKKEIGTIVKIAPLAICGFIYLNNSYFLDYLHFMKKDINIRELWARNNMPDWTAPREAAFYLKHHMKSDDTYFALASHPLYFNVLGKPVLPRNLYDFEFFPPETAYLDTVKSFVSRFDYRKNQNDLLEMIYKSPPEWIVVQVGHNIQDEIKSFPAFFSELAKKYKFVIDTGSNIIYKLNPNNEYVENSQLPISLLVRSYMIEKITIYQSKTEMSVSSLNNLSEKTNFIFFNDSFNLLQGQAKREIKFKDLFIEKNSIEVVNHLKKLGLSIVNPDVYTRLALPAEKPKIQHANKIAYQLISTNANSDIIRIFIKISDILYEGPGILGRYPPIFSGNGPPLAVFLIESKSKTYSHIYLYAVANSEATILLGNGIPKRQMDDLPT